MTFLSLFHNIFFLLIVSLAFSAQFIFGFRVSDLLVYIILFLSLFLSFRNKDFSLWAIMIVFLLIALVNDLYYFLNQVDYSNAYASINGNIRYDRSLLYVKYIIFFLIPITLTSFQNNKIYVSNNTILKNKIKNALVTLYVLMIILLAYQYISLQPERLSFPFSSPQIMWPKRTDGHVLGVAMAFLIAYMHVIFSKRLSVIYLGIIIIPGIIIMLLTGSSGGVLLLLVFYLLLLNPKKIIKYLFIASLSLIILFLIFEIDLLKSYIESTPIIRAISIPRLIYENILTDDINRFTVHHYVIKDLFESNRLLNGFGFMAMPFYYYDALIPSLIGPVGIIGLFSFFLFLYLIYKKNLPSNIEQRKLFRIFSILFLLSIFISEYHLVLRCFAIMAACLYYFSGINIMKDDDSIKRSIK